MIKILNKLEDTKLSITADTTIVALLQKGWEGKKTLEFNFENEGVTFNFIALIIGTKSDSFHFETISNHRAENTKADFSIRAVQFDKSSVDYTGMISINPDAQGTHSHLSHHTLLLSKDAKTQTCPSLEIEADNVKASHAATVGKVDDEVLFYLTSRGLKETEAKEILVKGFILSDIQKIPDEKIQQQFTSQVEKHYARKPKT